MRMLAGLRMRTKVTRISAEPVARTSASRNAESSAESSTTFATTAFRDQSVTAVQMST